MSCKFTKQDYRLLSLMCDNIYHLLNKNRDNVSYILDQNRVSKSVATSIILKSLGIEALSKSSLPHSWKRPDLTDTDIENMANNIGRMLAFNKMSEDVIDENKSEMLSILYEIKSTPPILHSYVLYRATYEVTEREYYVIVNQLTGEAFETSTMDIDFIQEEKKNHFSPFYLCCFSKDYLNEITTPTTMKLPPDALNLYTTPWAGDAFFDGELYHDELLWSPLGYMRNNLVIPHTYLDEVGGVTDVYFLSGTPAAMMLAGVDCFEIIQNHTTSKEAGFCVDDYEPHNWFTNYQCAAAGSLALLAVIKSSPYPPNAENTFRHSLFKHKNTKLAFCLAEVFSTLIECNEDDLEAPDVYMDTLVLEDITNVSKPEIYIPYPEQCKFDLLEVLFTHQNVELIETYTSGLVHSTQLDEIMVLNYFVISSFYNGQHYLFRCPLKFECKREITRKEYEALQRPSPYTLAAISLGYCSLEFDNKGRLFITDPLNNKFIPSWVQGDFFNVQNTSLSLGSLKDGSLYNCLRDMIAKKTPSYVGLGIMKYNHIDSQICLLKPSNLKLRIDINDAIIALTNNSEFKQHKELFYEVFDKHFKGMISTDRVESHAFDLLFIESPYRKESAVIDRHLLNLINQERS